MENKFIATDLLKYLEGHKDVSPSLYEDIKFFIDYHSEDGSTEKAVLRYRRMPISRSEYRELILKKRMCLISEDELTELGKISGYISSLGYEPKFEEADYILFKKYLYQYNMKHNTDLRGGELEDMLKKVFI